MWIYPHGMLEKIFANGEFNRKLFLKFLQEHKVEFMKIPVRRNNKLGIVGRRNGILRRIPNKISMDNTNGTIEQIVARTKFMSNRFSASRL